MPRVAGLYFESRGPEDAPAVILSSDLDGSAGDWAPNLEALTRTHRVILYDHRGTGRSERALPPRLRVGDMAQDMLTILDAAAIETASVVGLGAGAAIGLSMAARAPARVERLVAVNGWPAPDPHVARCFEAQLALLKSSGVPAFVRAGSLFRYPPNWISANGAALEAEEAEFVARFPGIESLEARVAALLAFDIEARLAEIAAPTLIVVAEDDMLVPPRSADRLAATLPRAHVARMTGGHACNLTQAEPFNRLVAAWLTNAAPAKA